MSEKTLEEKTKTGVSWSFADNIASTRITSCGVGVGQAANARRIGRVDSADRVFIAVFNSLVNSGFSSALIRKKNTDNVDYNTVFLFNLAFSVFLFAVLYVIAPAISRFFNEPELVTLTRVMGIIVLINAFAIVQQTILIKKIDFKTQTKISVIASIVSGLVGIGMALGKCGVWSLAGQQLSRQLLNTVLLWVFNSWRPTLQFSGQRFKELFSFGSKMLGLRIV